MKTRRIVLCSALLLPALAAVPAQASADAPVPKTGLSWELTPTGATVGFRGLAAVSARTAWLAGSKGTVLRTRDGGKSWQNVSPPGAGELEFRDVEAFGPDRAVVLAIGEGQASRVFRTDDGGKTWKQTFQNEDPKAFYDCVSFSDRKRGLVLGDPVDGKYRILATKDGGRSWKVLPSAGMPPALEGEAAFAASGQCMITRGRDAWFATGGGASKGRVFHSRDRGRTWTVSETTIPAGDPARGVFALAFRDSRHGIAVGGDYRPDQQSPDASAVTADRGKSWTRSARPPAAYRSGVTWVAGFAAIAVGPTGSDLSLDGGKTWKQFDTGSFDTIDCAGLACWASGTKGRAARLKFR